MEFAQATLATFHCRTSCSAGNLVGKEGEGFKIAMFALEQVGHGLGRLESFACRDASVAYARNERLSAADRRAPTGQQMIANMEADYEMCHSGFCAGSRMRDGLPKRCRRQVAGDDQIERAASDAIQIHGANGHTNDYPVERYLRNCSGSQSTKAREIHTIMQADYALGVRKMNPDAAICLPGDLEAEIKPTNE